MIPGRKVFNDDQVLMLFSMTCITTLIILGLIMLSFAPSAKGETVIPLVSIGVAAIATFVRQPAFPATPPADTGEKGASATKVSEKVPAESTPPDHPDADLPTN